MLAAKIELTCSGGGAWENLRFSCVVPAFAVTTEEHEFIVDIIARLEIQGLDIIGELLPLSLGPALFSAGIGRIRPIDQPKVVRSLNIVHSQPRSQFSSSGQSLH